MKRFLAILALVVAFAATATAARADNPGWMTCNKRITNLTAFYYSQSHEWFENDRHYCLLNQTYSWEVQYSVDGGKHWADWVDDHVVVSGLCQNGCNHKGYDTGSSCSSNHTVTYRVKAWAANGFSIQSRGFGAGFTCGGGVI